MTRHPVITGFAICWILASAVVVWRRCSVEPAPPAFVEDDLTAVEVPRIRTEWPRLPPQQPVAPAAEPVAGPELAQRPAAEDAAAPPEPSAPPEATAPPKPPAPPPIRVVAAAPPSLPRDPAARIERLLDTPVALDAVEAPFAEVVAALGERLGETILVMTDPRARPIEPELSTDLVSLSSRRMPLRVALDLLANQTNRRWEVDAHGILFRDLRERRTYVYSEVYPLGNLATLRLAASAERPGDGKESQPNEPERSPAEAQLAAWQGVMRTIVPEEVGHVSLVTAQGVPMFCVTADYHGHAAVRGLLDELRAAAAGGPDAAPRPADPSLQVAARLNRIVSLDLPPATVVETVERLAALGGFSVAWDDWMIVELRFFPQERQVPTLRGTMTLRAALRRLLRPLGLCYEVCSGVLIVTTPRAANESPDTAHVYPLGDLAFDAATIAGMIAACVEPARWAAAGGPDEIAVAELSGKPLLLVTSNTCVHEQIADLLGALRRAVRDAAAGRLQPAYRLAPPKSPTERAIEAALDRPVTLSFDGVPLRDVVRQIASEQAIPAVLDEKSLPDVGIDSETPVTFQASGISLRSALSLMLGRMALTYEVWDEQMLITTRAEAESRLVPVVYSIGDLVPVLGSLRQRSAGCDALRDLIGSTIAPTSWSDVGGPGEQEVIGCRGLQALVVWQTPEVHAKIERLLGTLRQIAEDVTAGRPASDYGFAPRMPTERAFAKALARRTTLRCDHEPLAEAVQRIGQQSGIYIVVDLPLLEEDHPLHAARINGRVNDEPLGDALPRLLCDAGLACLTKRDYLLITVPDEVTADLTLRFYNVNDLIAAAPRRRNPDADCDDLMDVIRETADPKGWDKVGGPGSMVPIFIGGTGFLAIAQTDGGHAEVKALLATLRCRLGR